MKYTVGFRPFKPDDASFVNELRKDEEMESLIAGAKRLVAPERDKKWIEELILGNSEQSIYIAVTYEDAIVGYISISSIDLRNGTCRVGGIKIAPGHAGKGFGSQAVLYTAKYVFEELRMVRYQAECLEHNHHSINMFLKLGFQKEGLLRSVVFKNGIYNNEWVLSLTNVEYEAIKIKFDL